MLTRKKDAGDWCVHANFALPGRRRWNDVALVLRLTSAFRSRRFHRRSVILSLPASDEVLEVAHAIARVFKAKTPDNVFWKFDNDFVVKSVFVLAVGEDPTVSGFQVLLEKQEGSWKRRCSQDPLAIISITLGNVFIAFATMLAGEDPSRHLLKPRSLRDKCSIPEQQAFHAAEKANKERRADVSHTERASVSTQQMFAED